MSGTEDLHVLFIEKDPDDQWDPEWHVLHPPTCVAPADLADEDNPHGASHRCAIDFELSQVGDDAFDVVNGAVRQMGQSWPSLGDVLPAGRFLCRWWAEDNAAGDDYRSGIELVEGPVWDGHRQGWDRT